VPHPTTLAVQLRNIVLAHTNRGVANLDVQVLPERVVLRGEAATFYTKQLAQESVRKMLPQMKLVNAIQVAT
jgi:BON domain